MLFRKNDGYKGGDKFSFPVFIHRFKEAFLGLLMPFIILGGIYGGIFTPTESGAVACVYGLIISLFVYRSMKVSDLKATFNEAGLLSAMVLFIIGTANLMSWILTTEQIPAKVSSIVGDFTGSQLVLLLIIAAIFLFVGTFLELNAAIILLVPILLPILGAFDVDLIHFGIIMVVNLAIGLLTPPLGVNLFVAKSLADISFNQIVKAAIPFLIVLIINLLLFILIPEISTALL